MSDSVNLVAGLMSEVARCSELACLYDAMPHGCGRPGAMLIRADVAAAIDAAAAGDTVAMFRAFQALQGCKS